MTEPILNFSQWKKKNLLISWQSNNFETYESLAEYFESTQWLRYFFFNYTTNTNPEALLRSLAAALEDVPLGPWCSTVRTSALTFLFAILHSKGMLMIHLRKHFCVYRSKEFQSICLSISRFFFSYSQFQKKHKNMQEPKALVIDRNLVNVQINNTCGF